MASITWWAARAVVPIHDGFQRIQIGKADHGIFIKSEGALLFQTTAVKIQTKLLENLWDIRYNLLQTP